MYVLSEIVLINMCSQIQLIYSHGSKNSKQFPTIDAC